MTRTVQVARPARVIRAHAVKTLNAVVHSFVRMENALRSSVKLFQVDQTLSVQSQTMQLAINAMLAMWQLQQHKQDVVSTWIEGNKKCT